MPNITIESIGDDVLQLEVQPAFTGSFDGAIIPASAFDATNTVKKYIDDVADGVNANIANAVDSWMDDNADESITDWLDEHPEATTTVQDGSITNAKLVQSGGILSEVINIRTDADGTTYQSAGDSVRGQVSDVYAYLGETTRNVVSLPYASGWTKEANGIIWSVAKSGTITISGRSSGTPKFNIGSYTLTAGETYTLSVSGTSTITYTRAYDSSYSGTTLVTIHGAGSKTFTVPASGVVNLAIFMYTGNDASGTITVWLEKGNIPHPFISHYTAKDQIARERIEALEQLGASQSKAASDCYLYRDKVPSYYIEKPQYPESFNDDEYLETKIKSVPDGPSFMFVTDTHWESNEGNTVPLMQYVRKRLGISKVVFGGDAINRRSSVFSGDTLLAEGKYLAKNDMAEFAYQCRAAWGGDFLAAVGNHDANLVDANDYSDGDWQQGHIMVPFSQIREVLQGDLPSSAVREDVSTKLANYASGETLSELQEYFLTNFYVDDDVNGIRFIVLNSGNPGFASVANGDETILMNPVKDVFDISQARELLLHMDFAYNAMLTTPGGYHVVLVAHQALGHLSDDGSGGAGYGWYAKIYGAMLRALKRKESATVDTHVTSSDSANLVSWVGERYKTYDFTHANSTGTLMMLNGHVHYDSIVVGKYANSTFDAVVYDGSAIDQSANGDIPSVTTTTDAVGRWHDAVDAYEVPMESDTTTDQAFDVFTFTDSGIKITRFGAGNDRTILID